MTRWVGFLFHPLDDNHSGHPTCRNTTRLGGFLVLLPLMHHSVPWGLSPHVTLPPLQRPDNGAYKFSFFICYYIVIITEVVYLVFMYVIVTVIIIFSFF